MKPLACIVLIGLITALAGCQAATNLVSGKNPELTAYAAGLHAADEPLYSAHETLTQDAVNLGQALDAVSAAGQSVPPDLASAVTRAGAAKTN